MGKTKADFDKISFFSDGALNLLCVCVCACVDDTLFIFDALWELSIVIQK